MSSTAITVRKIFWIAVLVRCTVAAAITIQSYAIGDLSRDSYWYDWLGKAIAAEYAQGNINWSKWIDDGWFQFIGLVYFLLGPYLMYVLLVNAFLAGGACVLTYRFTLRVYGDTAVATLTGLLVAVFPSAVYFSAMPLKEAAAMFALAGLVWGLVRVRLERDWGGLRWMAIGLAIVAALRVYLFYLSFACCLLCLVPLRLPRGFQGVVHLAALGATGILAAALSVNALEVDLSKYPTLQYFDVDYVNEVRADMIGGKSGIFGEEADAGWTGNVSDNIWKALTGLYYFFFSIDPTNLRRSRQAAAIPEMIFFLFAMPYFCVGLVNSVRHRLHESLPVLLFGVLLVCVYTGATTNGGAMYRWRVQALPFLISIVVYGAHVSRWGFLAQWLRRLRQRTIRPLSSQAGYPQFRLR